MTGSAKTKAAFISSLVSLILCCTMLMGTTYAWFAKTVSSENNVIEGGSLGMDVELFVEDPSGIGGEWVSVKKLSSAPIFDDTHIWQPGKSHTKYFKVSNIGNLSLKWEASLVKAVHSSLNPLVSPYINVEVTNDSPNTSGVSAITMQNSLTTIDEYIYGTSLVAEPFLAKGSIEPVRYDEDGNIITDADSDSDYFAVTISMAGNAPMDIAGENLGQFDLRVVATQEMSDFEEDSFGSDYDEGSSLPDPVGTADQLAAIFETLETHRTITLDRDYDLSGTSWTPIAISGAGQYTVYGDGHTIKNLTVEGDIASLFSKVSGSAKLVINDLTVEGASLTSVKKESEDSENPESSAAAFVGFVDGAGGAEVALTNCHVKDSSIITTSVEKGGYAGAFIGYNSGNKIELSTLSAQNVSINTIYGSCGGIIGHTSGLTATNIILSQVSVTNTSERDEAELSKAGIFAGTLDVDPVTVTDLTYSECTSLQHGTAPDSRLVGRFVNGAQFVLEETVFTE